MFARFRTILFTAAALVLTLTACGNDESATGPSTGKAQLTLTNTSNNYITFVRTKTCGASSYGGDILGSGILGKNESRSWEFNPGCIDIRVTPAETGADYLYLTNVQLEAGKTKTMTIAAFPPVSSIR